MYVHTNIYDTYVVIARLTSFCTYFFCPKTQYIKPRGQIRTYDAEDAFEFLNSHGQNLTLDHPAQSRKKGGFEEPEEPEPELMERTMGMWKLTKEFGLIEAGIKVCEDIDWNDQRTSRNRQGIVRILACCEEIEKEKKGHLTRQISVPGFFIVIFRNSCIATSIFGHWRRWYRRPA
jgi:hypothetical protein